MTRTKLRSVLGFSMLLTVSACGQDKPLPQASPEPPQRDSQASANAQKKAGKRAAVLQTPQISAPGQPSKRPVPPLPLEELLASLAKTGYLSNEQLERAPETLAAALLQLLKANRNAQFAEMQINAHYVASAPPTVVGREGNRDLVLFRVERALSASLFTEKERLESTLKRLGPRAAPAFAGLRETTRLKNLGSEAVPYLVRSAENPDSVFRTASFLEMRRSYTLFPMNPLETELLLLVIQDQNHPYRSEALAELSGGRAADAQRIVDAVVACEFSGSDDWPRASMLLAYLGATSPETAGWIAEGFVDSQKSVMRKFHLEALVSLAQSGANPQADDALLRLLRSPGIGPSARSDVLRYVAKLGPQAQSAIPHLKSMFQQSIQQSRTNSKAAEEIAKTVAAIDATQLGFVVESAEQGVDAAFMSLYLCERIPNALAPKIFGRIHLKKGSLETYFDSSWVRHDSSDEHRIDVLCQAYLKASGNEQELFKELFPRKYVVPMTQLGEALRKRAIGSILEDFRATKNAGWRRSLIRLLVRFPQDHAAYLAQVEKILNQPGEYNHYVVAAASEVAAQLVGKDVLDTATSDRLVQEIEKLVDRPDVQDSAMRYLRQLGPLAKAALPALVARLDREDLPPDGRERLAWTIASLEARDEQLHPLGMDIEAMIETAQRRDNFQNRRFVEKLGAFGHRATSAVPVLVRLAQQRHEPNLSAEAIIALARIEGDTPRVREIVSRAEHAPSLVLQVAAQSAQQILSDG